MICLFSGDTLPTVLSDMLALTIVHAVLGWVEMARMKRRLGVTMFVSSPVQLDQLVVEEAERMQFCGTNASYFCFVGGGAPSPRISYMLKKRGVCADVLYGWGSYESGSVGTQQVLNMMYNMPTNRYVLDKSNIIKWTLSDFGPYKDDSGNYY